MHQKIGLGPMLIRGMIAPGFCAVLAVDDAGDWNRGVMPEVCHRCPYSAGQFFCRSGSFSETLDRDLGSIEPEKLLG